MAIENVIEIRQITLNNPEFDHKKSLGILSKVSAPLAENFLHLFKANFSKFSHFRNWEILAQVPHPITKSLVNIM